MCEVWSMECGEYQFIHDDNHGDYFVIIEADKKSLHSAHTTNVIEYNICFEFFFYYRAEL